MKNHLQKTSTQRPLPRAGHRLTTAVVAGTAAVVLAGCGGYGGYGGGGRTEAQTVYTKGTVLTMDDMNTVAEAVAVRKGKILAVGRSADIDPLIGPNTMVVDLNGKTMIPGIYDAHSHISSTGTISLFEANLNSPPISTVENIDQLIELLQQQQAKVGPDAWVTGFGYDDTLLTERRHPTRADLDRVSATQPVYIRHVSGHLSVANSAALTLAGVTAGTPNPPGGVIRKDASGEPDGVLEETAAQLVGRLRPPLTAAQYQEAVEFAGNLYASRGVTTANEGAASPGVKAPTENEGSAAPDGITAIEKAAQAGTFKIRVIAWPTMEAIDVVDAMSLKSKKVKIGGVKDFSDGSIQGYTGYLSQPYYTPFHGDSNYRGFPRYSRDVLIERVLKVHKAGRQAIIHANGDAAIADVLYAYKKAQETFPREDPRHVVIHAQMAREDQLDEMKALGVIPSFFVLHTYYWGDRHRDIFMGPERAARISPTKSAKDRGLKFTIHTDTPVVPMEPMRLIWSAVNRITTSGKVLGSEQRISPMDALRATTINSAYENFEEKERGSIEVGKWADFAVLSANPTSVAPMTIKDIKVLRTVVEGKTVYEAAQP